MARRTVVFSFLGVTLDRGHAAKRWKRWRPNPGLVSQPDLPIDRVELLHPPESTLLADQIVADIAELSPRTTVVCRPIPLPDAWDFEAVYGALHDLARSYPFDVDAEDYLVHITTGTHVIQICLFLLVEARELPGRLIQTEPSRGREATVAGQHRIIDLDLSRYAAIAERFATVREQGTSFLKEGIETRNAAYNQLIDQIEQVAVRSDMPLLLMGPTGAGKTRLARRIYDLKKARRRLKGEFVEVNCATLRGDSAMGALFGHTRGAFTGAVKDRPGLLRTADQGLLFLDEIGELGLDEQAMLLRALESGRFLPVGADHEVHSQFQLIAGTNRDLRQAALDGAFRSDLLARIDTWTWSLPALKDRPEDIEPNLDFELDRVGRAAGRRLRFHQEARARFLRFAMGPDATWDRNFRDLGAAVQRMGTLAPGDRIDEPTVLAEMQRLQAAWAPAGPPVDDRDALLIAILGESAAAELDRFDAVQLAEVLRVCRQSQAR